MSHQIHTMNVGTATVTTINVGDVRIRLADLLVIPQEERTVALMAPIEQPARFPTQCFLLAFKGAAVLIDACEYTSSFPPTSPYSLPNYELPPDLITQLHQQGVKPADITHVIITHAHFDHYSGTTIERAGQIVPAFPHARYLLHRADWELPNMQQALQDHTSPQYRTLGVLHQAGLLELVEGPFEPLAGLTLLPAPGESPGHQIVRLHSQGQTLYCLGDLYHDPVEVEHPTWMSTWAEPTQTLRSRQTLAEAALGEQAQLCAAHIPGFGRLDLVCGQLKWRSLLP